MDFQEKRKWMVETQIISRGITDQRVIDAMLRVPRHRFVPEEELPRAYEDMALPIGYGQTISQPYMVAIMTELLSLQGDEKVLEIGTGSGYQTAILAELSKEVHSVERIPELAERAKKTLDELGYKNVRIYLSNGTLGLPEEAPFDRILVTAGAPEVPTPLIEQLKEGGILVCPVGTRYSQQLVRLKKTPQGPEITYHTMCLFVPLIGEYGWKQ
ncbi:MAG: protein-L-isoaspartate(D-aspartate) O-methyltransferase [Nitrospirae bacterium]|nr:MAG: protein-L-isoaspartate(D-aspartate) O-methyltransferase [Nitrospirota bacterium]